MQAFGMSADYVDWELDGAQGWAYANWARERERSVWGDSVVRKSPGYVKQEYNNLMEQYHDAKPKPR